jgi:hypothetical protein
MTAKVTRLLAAGAKDGVGKASALGLHRSAVETHADVGEKVFEIF